MLSTTSKATLTINECGQYPDVRLRIPMVPTALFTKVAGLGVKRDCFLTLLMLVVTTLGRRDWGRTRAYFPQCHHRLSSLSVALSHAANTSLAQ